MQSRHEPTNKAKSAALLAAEAAFFRPGEASEQLFAMGLPAITVLRARGTATLTDSTVSAAGAVSDEIRSSEPQLPALKVPRVFLVKAAPLEDGSTPSDAWPLREVQAKDAGALEGLGEGATTPAHRAGRSRSRPPPVTLVFSASGAASYDDGQVMHDDVLASRDQTQGDPPEQSLACLAVALADMDHTFADISWATRFTLDDLRDTAQWERLSSELDQVALEIEAASAKAEFRAALHAEKETAAQAPVGLQRRQWVVRSTCVERNNDRLGQR